MTRKVSSKTTSSGSSRLDSRNDLSQIARIGQTLAACGSDPVSTAAILALSCRGLLPERFIGTVAELLIKNFAEKLFTIDAPVVDSTEFGYHLTAWIDLDSLKNCDADALCTALLELVEPTQFQSIFKDPLFVGWIYQTRLMALDDYGIKRNERTMRGLARITQWFTPAWISEFLVDECFSGARNEAHQGSAEHGFSKRNPAEQPSREHVPEHDPAKISASTKTFLDSACGAGHILIPALMRLLAEELEEPIVERKDKGRAERRAEQDRGSARNSAEQARIDDALSIVLADRLFGIDVDPLMASLSAFAIFLACRDLSAHAPFPIPRVYSFTSNTSAKASAHSQSAWYGSLLLGVEPKPDISIYRIDGETVPLSSLPQSFDMQAINPPYLSHRLMPDQLAAFLKSKYNGCHYDLYAAFLELSLRLMKPDGRMSMICQQSFLSTARYEELRSRLLSNHQINTIVQLGAGSFASRGGEKVNNAIVSISTNRRSITDAHSSTDVERHSFRNDPGSNYRANAECERAPSPDNTIENGAGTHSVCAYKLISAQSKNLAKDNGINAFEKTLVDRKTLLATTRMIPGSPIVPFCPLEIAQLFETCTSLEHVDGIVLTNGLFTCDNKRFVRHFSEMQEQNANYVPYDKGGGQKWFSTTPYLLEWKDDGNEIREFRASRGQSRALPGERFYFKPGVTYSYIGTKGFKARLLSPGSVFDIASSALFSTSIDLNYMLAFLNSALVRFILGTLNPTINFQIGDLRRIPMIVPNKSTENLLAQLAGQAVKLAQQAEELNQTSSVFRGPLSDRFKSYDAMVAHISSINEREAAIQADIDEAIFDLYKVKSTTRDIIKTNEWVLSTEEPIVSTPSKTAFEKAKTKARELASRQR